MKTSLSALKISRRRFIATTAAAVAAPTIIPASALGADGRPAPSERITMGVVGWGMQGPSNTGNFMRESDCQVVATCNIDKHHLEASVNEINKKYKNQDCKTYHDYREMMARTDIDAVMLAVPDHWHALIATAAANNKKDIYGEKPLARTIAETSSTAADNISQVDLRPPFSASQALSSSRTFRRQSESRSWRVSSRGSGGVSC